MDNNPILYQDNDWFIVNKPYDISTHGAWGGDIALQEWIQLHWDKNLFVCSRLDKGTSGVLLFAKNPSASGKAEQIHASGESSKEYCFLSDVDSITVRGNASWKCDAEIDGKAAITYFTRLGCYGGRFLYRAVIQAGKTHQIRRHSSISGVPILGDEIYGGKKFPRLCLHCSKLQWPGIPQDISAPLPVVFTSASTQMADLEFLVCLDRRGNWLPGITNAFRCIHRGEISDLDFAVDFLGGYFCVWVFEEKYDLDDFSKKIEGWLEILSQLHHAQGGVIRMAGKHLHNQGRNEKVFGSPPTPWFVIEEHNILYEVPLTEQPQICFFLEHRDNRRWVFKSSCDKRVADLFAPGYFGVCSALGNAEVVFSVDISKKYLQQGMKNFKLNHLDSTGKGKFVEEDVRKWLARQKRKVAAENRFFELVICDPPAFTTTKEGKKFSISDEWESLASSCSSILAQNGTYLFSSNYNILTKRKLQQGLEKIFSDVNEISAPLDFPQIDSTYSHLKVFRLQK